MDQASRRQRFKSFLWCPLSQMVFRRKIARIYFFFQKFCSRCLPTAKRFRWTERKTHHWAQCRGTSDYLKITRSSPTPYIFLHFIKIMETLFGFWTFMYSILAWDTLTRTTEAQNSNGFNLPMDEIRRGLWYDIHHKPFIFEGIIFNLINLSLWTQFNYILINWSVIFKHVDVVIYMLWIYIFIKYSQLLGIFPYFLRNYPSCIVATTIDNTKSTSFNKFAHVKLGYFKQIISAWLI